MQYVNCMYSAQGDYLCHNNEILDSEPTVEGFYGDAALTPEKKLTATYNSMKSLCTSTNTDANKNSCIEKLATFYNDKCSRKEACSPLSGCGTSRKDPCPKGKLKQCSNQKFSQSMITNGTNYINKSIVLPDEKDMPNLC